MKKIVIGMLCLWLVACGGKQTTSKIELNAGKGEVVGLTLDELVTKLEQKETFVFLFSQTYCGSCMNFFAQSDAYTTEVGLTLFDVTLDKETKSEAEIQTILDTYFDDFSATPTLYFVRDGKVVDVLNANEQEVTLASYQQFLVDNNIVK